MARNLTRLAALTLAIYAALVTGAQAQPRPVYIVDTSTEVTRANVAAALPALQASISQDLEPVWGVDAQLELVPAGKTAPVGAWTVTLTDDTDCWDCYGYHDVTPNDVPYAKVFPAVSFDQQEPWTLTFDHELKEMLVDPYISRVEWNGKHRLYLVEAADPVEDSRFGYWRNGVDGVPVLLSDFPTANWYRARSRGPYDFRGYCKRPEQVLPGGYVSFWQNGYWHQVFG